MQNAVAVQFAAVVAPVGISAARTASEREAFTRVSSLFAQDQPESRGKFLGVLSIGVSKDMNAVQLLELFLGSMFIEGAEDSDPSQSAYMQGNYQLDGAMLSGDGPAMEDHEVRGKSVVVL
jgi:hypothetical protein